MPVFVLYLSFGPELQEYGTKAILKNMTYITYLLCVTSANKPLSLLQIEILKRKDTYKLFDIERQ